MIRCAWIVCRRLFGTFKTPNLIRKSNNYMLFEHQQRQNCAKLLPQTIFQLLNKYPWIRHHTHLQELHINIVSQVIPRLSPKQHKARSGADRSLEEMASCAGYIQYCNYICLIIYKCAFFLCGLMLRCATPIILLFGDFKNAEPHKEMWRLNVVCAPAKAKLREAATSVGFPNSLQNILKFGLCIHLQLLYINNASFAIPWLWPA